MEIVKARSFARAGLLGNPSDGYFGKTLSFAFANFGVDLSLTESSRMRFVPGEVDDAMFDSPEQLVHDLRIFGYYGGIRMLKAVSKLFFEYCMEHGIEIPRRNFTAEYKINVPRLVGLSGSSAICSAMLKALMKFYGVTIPEKYAPTVSANAEKRWLLDWLSAFQKESAHVPHACRSDMLPHPVPQGCRNCIIHPHTARVFRQA